MNLYTFLKTAISLHKELEFQKKYIAKNIKPYLEYLEEKYNGTLTPYQKFKILTNYGLYVPSIMCVSYKKLFSQPFTLEDRKLATMLGVFTPLYDDLFDELNLDPKQIQKLTIDPASFEADIFMTKIVKEIGSDLIDTAANKASYLNILEEVLKIQVDTLEQFNPSTSQSELQRITWEKGMISYVYYFTHFFGTPNDNIRELLFDIGGLHQLSNDIFDMYKDCQEKSYTLANTCKDFTLFKAFFLEKVTVMKQKIIALPYREKEKRYFSLIMLSLIGSTIVAIDYLIQIENKKGKNIDWFKEAREVLVIDMDKPINRLKLVYNVWKLAKIS
ncbi:MAG: hypothetical protein WCH78_07065 [Bacteroidota bacterium]